MNREEIGKGYDSIRNGKGNDRKGIRFDKEWIGKVQGSDRKGTRFDNEWKGKR